MNNARMLMMICRDNGINTPAKAFTSNFCTPYALQNEFGYNYTKLLLEAHITALNAFLNQSARMDGEQVEFAAIQILEDECFKWYNMAEFNLVFNRIKTSHYGNLYNRFDVPTLFDILRKYDNDRTAAIEQVRIAEKSTHNIPYKFDYEKIKADGAKEAEARKKLQAKSKKAHEEAVAMAERVAQEAKRIVDGMNIADDAERQAKYNEVYNQMLMEGGSHAN